MIRDEALCHNRLQAANWKLHEFVSTAENKFMCKSRHVLDATRLAISGHFALFVSAISHGNGDSGTHPISRWQEKPPQSSAALELLASSQFAVCALRQPALLQPSTARHATAQRRTTGMQQRRQHHLCPICYTVLAISLVLDVGLRLT